MDIDGLNYEEIIKIIHSGYLNRLNFIGVLNDNNASSRFSWTGNKHIHIYIVMVYDREKNIHHYFLLLEKKKKIN